MEKVNLGNIAIRPVTRRDAESIHSYASDPLVTRYMTFANSSMDDTLTFVERAVDSWRRDPVTDMNFVVEQQYPIPEVIGGCGICISSYHSAELGYILRRDMWGQGIATRMVAFLIDLAFREMNVHRVIAHCAVANRASQRVLEKNDMRREGHLKSFLQKGEDWLDAYLYAIVEQEWNESR